MASFLTTHNILSNAGIHRNHKLDRGLHLEMALEELAPISGSIWVPKGHTLRLKMDLHICQTPLYTNLKMDLGCHRIRMDSRRICKDHLMVCLPIKDLLHLSTPTPHSSNSIRNTSKFSNFRSKNNAGLQHQGSSSRKDRRLVKLLLHHNLNNSRHPNNSHSNILNQNSANNSLSRNRLWSL